MTTLSTKSWEDLHTGAIGVDEAGRGPLAGPLVVAACMLKPGFKDTFASKHLLQDSKALSLKNRDAAYAALVESPLVAYDVRVIDAKEIDRPDNNILRATLHGMRDAALSLKRNHGATYVFVDGNRLPPDVVPHDDVAITDNQIRGETVVKGDTKVMSIAAASILAKVTRDALMVDFAKEYPLYGFDQHKGYGTKAHLAALEAHGPCAIHRRTFKPISVLFPKVDPN